MNTLAKIEPTWVSLGLNLLLSTPDIAIKEDILHKMSILDPTNDILYYYLGCIYKDTQPYKALAWFRVCFQMNPGNVENLLDYIKILFDLNMINYILSWNEMNGNILDKTNNPRVRFLYATICVKIHKLSKAFPIYKELVDNITQMPRDNVIFVYMNYAYLLGKMNRIEEGFATYTNYIIPWLSKYGEADFMMSKESQHALKCLHENYLIMYDYVYHDHLERYLLCRSIQKVYSIKPPFACMPPRLPPSPHNASEKSRVIRIGYVSSDYQEHAVSNFILPILKHHNHERFDIHLFTQKTMNTESIQNGSQKISIHEIQYMADHECASLIRRLEIDILFDLNGYTDGNRLGVFAFKPAPIQVSYIGYPNSLSLDFIQYRITDAIADNKDSKQIYTETRVYLPKCFLLFETTIQKNPLPPTHYDSQSKRPFIFGALNKELKNSKSAMDAWKRILEKVPGSQLLIKIDSEDMYEEQMVYYSRILNVDVSRIQIATRCSKVTDYVGLFGRIDLLLDTFPYSGTTTTCNALYNSTPVLTIYNKDYHCNNVSSSLLHNSGLGEFIAYTIDEYVEKAVYYGNGGAIPPNIHAQFMKCMDPLSFMKDYEELLEKLYIRHWNNIKNPVIEPTQDG